MPRKNGSDTKAPTVPTADKPGTKKGNSKKPPATPAEAKPTVQKKNAKHPAAPTKCEMCDHPLPTWADREAHMKKTKHCECFECGGYIQPGGVYVHWCENHSDQYWNDHHIASGDMLTLHDALPWVWEEYAKATGYNPVKDYGWHGDHSKGPSPTCSYCKVHKV